jgi:hypothetical protein
MKNKTPKETLYDIISATRPERVVTKLVKIGITLAEAYKSLPNDAKDSPEIFLITRTGSYQVGETFSTAYPEHA